MHFELQLQNYFHLYIVCKIFRYFSTNQQFNGKLKLHMSYITEHTKKSAQLENKNIRFPNFTDFRALLYLHFKTSSQKYLILY